MTRHFMPSSRERLCLKPCAMLSGSDILSPWLFNFATAKLPVEKAANKSNCCDYSINSTQIRIVQNDKNCPFISIFLMQACPARATFLAASEVVWVAEVKSTTSIFFAWRLIQNGMRPASNAVNVKSSWTRNAHVSCGKEKSTARRTTSGNSHKSR